MKNFKLREQDYMALQGMNEKQAGQFIKGLCGYAFEGKPFETKDAKLATAYAYAKVALDVSAQNRENGKKGGLIMAERMRSMKQMPKRTSVSDSPMDMLLKSSLMIYQKWGNMKFAYRNREFWCKGYYVDTITYLYGYYL